jgi:hypothetical protein
MMFSKLARSLGLTVTITAATISADAQFNITGVADKATPYVNTVTFTVGTQLGYSYAVFLNRDRIPTDVPVTLSEPDFYELNAYATNIATSTVTNRYVRFIVRSSERGGTEWGLPPHVPSPITPSAAAEFVGAQLRLIVPEDFPAGYEIPVVAWVVNSQNRAVRANGSLEAAGHPSVVIKRGVGSGFLAANNPSGALSYTPQIKGVQGNKTINIEANTVWTTIAGTLAGTTAWPDNSRIRVSGHISVPAGSTLTVGAGTIVQLNPGVNITNNGSILINGTVDQPVVFMPQSRSQPWGGFFMRTSTGLINATGTIFTGSGAEQTGGPGHRDEQCLFLVDSTPRITLTDCAAVYLAGQFGHAFNGGTFNFTRFLLQRATTGGEYTGASFTVNDSAFIEFPDDTANFVDGDNDALYFVSGSHTFTNTLFGWTKDDGIDSGGSGYGPLTYQSCWFESTFHEGNSLSGFKNVLARDTVYIDCGQGIENGYDGPTNRMEHCLFLANKVGLRHGDNYPDIGSYNGRESATNCLSLFNHRDVFGFNWRNGTGNGWTNATGQMTIISNWLSAPNVYFPSNSIWDPPVDAGLLSSFMSTPADAAVGVGFAVRTNRFAMTTLAQGVPVRLSSFTTNAVHVSYVFYNGAGGGFIGAGTISFAPGETMKRIYPDFNPGAVSPWDLYLTAATGGELTGLTNLIFEGSIPTPQVSLAVTGSVLPGYRIGEGTFIQLSAPSARPVSVNYTNWADGNPVGSGTIGFNPPETLKQLFVTEVNPFNYQSIQITLSAPGGATLGAVTSVTYINPTLTVAFGVAGDQANIDQLGVGLPVSLNSPAPSGVSVQFRIEGSGGVLTNGTLAFAGGEVSKLLVAPSINLPQENLLRATLFNAVGAGLGSPSSLYLVRSVPAPPATNTTLIARGSRWRYRDAASAAPAGWQNIGFDHETWPEGPAQLGFSSGPAELDEATFIADNNQITSYFRRGFSITDSNAFAGLSLWMLRDDAGVVYLNGTEIFRSPNLPGPPTVITYNTTSVAPNGENTIDTATTNRNALRTGTNVVAVEIHQQAPDSSDVSFDFELIGIGAPPTVPQNVYLGTFDGKVTIAWGDAALAIEATPELQGTNTVWTPMGLTSPVTITPDSGLPQRFFRLRK